MASTIKVDTIENVAGSGNVSLGSGHNLVVPGNITGSGTLGITGATTATGGVTIPASSTVGLNFGSGTDLAQLAMQSAVSNRVALRTTHTSTGDNNPFIIYQPSSAGAQNDALVVQTAGQINMEKQPSFCARLNSNPAMDIATVPFETVVHNVGNHYSNSTYRFTAPVTGRYYLSYSVRVNHGTSGHIIHPVFFINGNSDTTSRTIYKNDTSAQYMGATFSYVRQLNANDYVTVNMSSSSSGGNMQTGQCSFTGHLLG